MSNNYSDIKIVYGATLDTVEDGFDIQLRWLKIDVEILALSTWWTPSGQNNHEGKGILKKINCTLLKYVKKKEVSSTNRATQLHFTYTQNKTKDNQHFANSPNTIDSIK